MTIKPSDQFKILTQTPNTIFYEKPRCLEIDELGTTEYSLARKIEVLMFELAEKGPFLAEGQLGKEFYKNAPIRLRSNIAGKEVLYWGDDANRHELLHSKKILVLGAQIEDDQELVYFTSCNDITRDKNTFIRDISPSLKETKIYAVSHAIFSQYTTVLYPLSTQEIDIL